MDRGGVREDPIGCRVSDPDPRRLRRALRYRGISEEGRTSMATPDYGKHLKELRTAYEQSTPRQRAKVALDRMESPGAGPNRLITSVSAVEGLARALAVNFQISAGTAPVRAYRNLRDMNVVTLLAGAVAPARGTTMPALVGADRWDEFRWAVKYRNLLIHEGAFLNQGYCTRLLKATRALFTALEQMLP